MFFRRKEGRKSCSGRDVKNPEIKQARITKIVFCSQKIKT
jgi:hypothetical protein